jgi:hypothetical protein
MQIVCIEAGPLNVATSAGASTQSIGLTGDTPAWHRQPTARRWMKAQYSVGKDSSDALTNVVRSLIRESPCTGQRSVQYNKEVH